MQYHIPFSVHICYIKGGTRYDISLIKYRINNTLIFIIDILPLIGKWDHKSLVCGDYTG